MSHVTFDLSLFPTLSLVTDFFVPFNAPIADVNDAMGVCGDVMFVRYQNNCVPSLVKPGE
jgi:hypothetical protein